MKTTVRPVNHFPINFDPIAKVLNFDQDWLERQPRSKACIDLAFERVEDFSPGPALRSAVSRRGQVSPGPVAVVASVMPIDIAVCPIDILWKLDRKTLERMATNSCTPVVVLERLADHPMAEVRAAVSDNVNAPLYLIWTLAEDSDAEVRYQLAENHRLPLAVLSALTGDENPYVACRAQDTYDRVRAA